MNSATKHFLKKFNHENFSKILDELLLPDDLMAKKESISDTEIISELMRLELYDEVIQFFALGLPRREAIWWAYICAHELEGEVQHADTQNALRIINQWVHKPSEELRVSAQAFADALELYTPSSWAAMAVFWSDGNIAPKGKPEVLPDEFMCGYAVTNSLILAAEKAENPAEQKKWYIKQGLHISMGGNGRVN